MKCILMSCNNCNKEYAYEKVSDYIKSDMKVVCVPFASELHWQLKGDFTEYKNMHFKVFESFGIPKRNITVAKLSEGREKILEKIENADIIFFSGGYMENFMFIVKVLRLEFAFADLKEKKLFMGESAGTLVMQDEYSEVPFIEDDYRRYKKEKGLGFITKFDIMVHYNKNNKKHRRNKQLLDLLNLSKDVICLTDESLIIIDDDDVEIIGDYE